MIILLQSNKKVQYEASFSAKKVQKRLLSWYFYNLKVAKVAVLYVEANKGANLVPTLQSCSSRIDVKQFQSLIILDFQDVTVS